MHWLFPYRSLREAVRTSRLSMVSEKPAPDGYEWRMFIKQNNFQCEGLYLRKLSDPWDRQVPPKEAKAIREEFEKSGK